MALAHWTFHGCTDDERLQIQAFWEKRCPSLERLLVGFPEQLDGIEFTIRRATSPDRFQAAAVLPWTKPIAVEATATSWIEALDKIADNLVCQMKCYLEGRRREWVERRRAAVRRKLRKLNGAKPLLANRRGLAQREQFFALLRPLLAHLQPYIERELRLLNFQRRFPHQHWTSEEILDELLVRSWERIDSQGSDRKPDVWLMTILQEILGEMAFYPFRVAFECLLSQPITVPE